MRGAWVAGGGRGEVLSVEVGASVVPVFGKHRCGGWHHQLRSSCRSIFSGLWRGRMKGNDSVKEA